MGGVLIFQTLNTTVQMFANGMVPDCRVLIKYYLFNLRAGIYRY